MTKTVILAQEVIFKSDHFQVIRKNLEKNGKSYAKDIIERDPVVLILPLDKDGNVYLVEQFREALQKNTLELTSGLFNPKLDKSSLDAAKRELKEETGFTAKDWRHVATFNLAPSIIQKTDIFIAQNLKKGEQNFDFDEDIIIRKKKFKEVVEDVVSGKIETVPHVAAILMLEKVMKEGKIDE